jgi:hypothetical protein
LSLGTGLKDDVLSKAKYNSQAFGVGHAEEESGLARGCGEQGINVKRVASMLVGLGTRPVRTEHDFASKAEMEVDEPADEFCAWG